MSEPHEVVKLLVARMESNPEEFNDDDGRWAQWLDELIPFVTEEERIMLRKPMMQAIHEEVLDELCNGPEKRRKEEEKLNEYERHLAMAMRHTQMQAVQGLANVYSSGGGGGGSGASLPVSTSPYSSGGGSILPVANGGTNQLHGVIGSTPLRVSPTITGTRADRIMVDDPMSDSPMIEKIRKMLTRRTKK